MKNHPYRLKFHLEPPAGWLNDPNGLCQKDGVYHVFFQYVPEDAAGTGKKKWGHYTSPDLLSWTFLGECLSPDKPFDRDGVYSGSALTDEQGIHLFYTGNVKEKGSYDYILEGRGANQILVTLKDGIHPGEKELLLTREDYPFSYTCHVRDPKVWKEKQDYFMLLGGRKKGDEGAVLLYQSPDLHSWKLFKELTGDKAFGYMWECPDYFKLHDSHYLAFCPQGLVREETRFQNIYQSGYAMLESSIEETILIRTERFREWDMGFDFYAPQTFVDEKGRRILMGWMGLPDLEGEYENPTMAVGWQHCLTVPREITEKGGRLLQYPVEELKALRKEIIPFIPDEEKKEAKARVKEGTFDLELSRLEGEDFNLSLGEDLKLTYENKIFTMEFISGAGAGRTKRRVFLDFLTHVRLLGDTSALEVYLNKGEVVMSTRFYPGRKETEVRVRCPRGRFRLWEI